MPVDRGSWDGSVAGRRLDTAEINLKSPIRQSASGGSGAFLALADDDQRYWVKPLNNLQDPRVCVNEQIVGRLATRLGTIAPSVRTIRIGPAFTTWEFRPGRTLQEGIGHASADVPNVTETHSLDFRDKDDNGRHHAEVTGLYDWFFGSDPQWLIAQADEQRAYSHDHGHYFPGGPAWTATGIEGRVDDENPYPYTGGAFDPTVIKDIADRINAIKKDDIIAVLAALPAQWPVTDQELESMGFFVERRAPQVADRLRARWGVTK